MAKQTEEHKAQGETKRVFHEIRQTLRVDGINLNFRTWAGFERFFPMMWDSIRPNAETQAFEDGGDQIRAEAVRIASTLGRLAARSSVQMGESRDFRLRRAIELYHYINPKLLLLTSAVRLALEDDPAVRETRDSHPPLIERGVPARMYPMEMAAEKPDDRRVLALFEDIKKSLQLPSINSDYRTLALWPDYLNAYWKDLKPLISSKEFHKGADALRDHSRKLARELPLPILLSKKQIIRAGEDFKKISEKTVQFETLLPSLILNIALAMLEWQEAGEAARSPYPSGERRAA